MADEIQQKIEDLQKKHNTIVQRKAGLEGQLKAKKEELAGILQKIKDAGLDPKKIGSERDRVKAELEALVAKAEQEFSEVEQALESYPASK